MVRSLESRSSGPGLSPSQGCVMFLGKTLYFHSASLHPGVQMGTNKYAEARVFVKIFSNRDLFQSKRDQNGGSAAISCHVGKI